MAILAMLREFGSGATEIAHKVAATLNYEIVDRKRVHNDLKFQEPTRTDWAKAFDEHYPNVWDRNEWSFKGYVALIQSIIYEYAWKDKIAFIGLGAGFLMRTIPYVLKVRIEADMEDKISRIQGDDVVNRDTVKWLIEKADSEMAKGMYIVYGRHWDAHDEYDMVLNTSKEGQEEIIEKIVDTLREKDKLKTEFWRQTIELRARAAKIEAVIATDPTYIVSQLDVEPKEEGMARYGFVLNAIVHERDDVQEIKDVATALAGDLPIECNIHYRMFPRRGRRGV